VGQRISPVGVDAVLADQDLRPEPRQQRRDDRVEGAQPGSIAAPSGQLDIVHAARDGRAVADQTTRAAAVDPAAVSHRTCLLLPAYRQRQVLRAG